jgi:ribosomal protein L7/L12
MSQNKKIEAIKAVRDVVPLGLKEAKDYVEQRIWPTDGGETNQVALDMQRRMVGDILRRIGTDYQMPLD